MDLGLLDTSMVELSMLNVSEFENHKEEWRVAEQWFHDNKELSTRVNSSDGKFLLGVFTVGASGTMELFSEVLIYHTDKIIISLKRYCKRQKMNYSSYNWLYASPDVKDFPEEMDTPQSLGWPSSGCAVISCILCTEFQDKGFGNVPRPVTHGKMPRVRMQIDVRRAPYARASADCAVPMCPWVSVRRT